MNKLILLFCLNVFAFKAFSQQFSQYNTGTLYDSFENPAQRAFIPDSSRQFAANFLVPNFSANSFLSGDAQASLKSQLFYGHLDNTGLLINQGKYSRVSADANLYLIMLKMFTSLRDNQEAGLSIQIRTEGKALVSDESIALLNSSQGFNQTNYSNIFNGSAYSQTYYQLGVTYRRKINPQFALGIKVSALLGVLYKKVNIDYSSATFNNAADEVGIGLRGTYLSSYTPGYNITRHDAAPDLRNPGASVSIGTAYRSDDGFILQANVKDLGFIHWDRRSQSFAFDNSETVTNLSARARTDSIYHHVNSIIHNNLTTGSFTTPTDGRFEFSVNRTFRAEDEYPVKYSPTLVFSKELFYNGFIAALVNPFRYNDFTLTATTSYDNLRKFNFGLQAMYKIPNFEVYLGSDRLLQSANLAANGIHKDMVSILQNNSFSGASVFLGFALKFGHIIEHPLNANDVGL